MDLREWKRKTEDSIKENAKINLREGMDYDQALFDEDELLDEIIVENYKDIVEDFEEIDLIDYDDLQENVDEPQEVVEFNPVEFGEEMDIEAEVDLNTTVMNSASLGKIRDLLFAEDYEVEFFDEANRAKVVFKRAQGEISKMKKCGKGMKLSGNRCVPQTGTQKSKERVKGN